MYKLDNNKQADDLYQAILQLASRDEARRFFRDLLTEAEINEFGKRWQAARLLDQKRPYSEIEKSTGLSSATVARISKWLNHGMDGYKLVLKKIRAQHHTEAAAGRSRNQE
mgnify:CR=1 FL=1